jgi:antitoxin component YwqK of YwqJK toxin-antitoxin module
MKKLFLIPLLLMSLASSPTWSEELSDLVVRDELYYKKFSNEPFTGHIEGKTQGYIKNGKKEGEWVNYWDNGQLFIKTTFKNGKHHGPYLSYHRNGKPWINTTLRDGLEDGFHSLYWPDGNLEAEGNMKLDKRDGSWIGYYENGNLHFKGNYIMGEKDGVWKVYDEDTGTLISKQSGTFKNGIKVGD